MYVDRMIGFQPTEPKLVCDHCDRELGIQITYAKENRPAYRLFQSSVKKTITTQSAIK